MAAHFVADDRHLQDGVTPNVISFIAAMSTCEKDGQWQHALSLLENIYKAGVTLEVTSLDAAISACEKGG